ncbi:MAG: alpha/beta fold hydrolase [Candidatus Nanopelagicales bacterium]
MEDGGRRGVVLPLLCIWVIGAGSAVLAWSMATGFGRLLAVAVVGMLTALGSAVVARAGRAWAGLAELLAAVAGIGVGATRGVRFIGADYLAWIAVAGLLAGLALLILGTWDLLAGTRGWWRLPVGLSALICLPLALYTLAVPLAATNSPRGPAPPTTGQTVTFRTSDGVELSGSFTPGRNGAAIVVVPGAGSDRTGAAEQASVLADAGYAVLTYDPRGHGLSGGRAMEFGWAGDQDVAAAVDFLSSQAGIDPARIGALGMSMGGEEVLGAAASDLRIRATVAEGATNRVAGDFDWLPEQYGWRGRVQQLLDVPRFALVDLFTAQPPPLTLREAVAAIAPRPVLLIAAGAVPDEQYATAHIASGSPATVTTWVVPDAGHIGGLSTQPELWRKTVLGFFDEHL